MNKTKLLTIIYATLQITNAYCMYYDDSYSIPDNNNTYSFHDYFPNNDLTQDINSQDMNMQNMNIQNINLQDMNMQDVNMQDMDMQNIDNELYYITNNDNLQNENERIFLGKKSKRSKENIQNVKLNYREFIDTNKEIKSDLKYNINLAKNAYNTYCELGDVNKAEYYFKKIKQFEKLDSDKFPILDDLNITEVNYTDFKMNNTVQKVKDLKDIIKNMIDYEDKNYKNKSKRYKKLKKVLQTMQNDEMTKKMFNTLKKIGVIAHNPNRIIFFKNNADKNIMLALDDTRKYFENVCDSNDNNKIKNSMKLLYKITTNNNFIKMMFDKQLGAVKIIPIRLRPAIVNLMSKINSSGLNKEFIKFKINSANTTFNLMKQRFIKGEEPIFEYNKSPEGNRQAFRNYYKEMLTKTDLFFPAVSREKETINSIVTILQNYKSEIMKKKNKTSIIDSSKLNTIETLIEFLKNNVVNELYYWYYDLQSMSSKIMYESWSEYVRKANLEEWLQTIESIVNNPKKSKFEQRETIYNFVEQISYFKSRLSQKKNNSKTAEILSKILTNNYVNKCITNDYIKNIFKERYHNFFHQYVKKGFVPSEIEKYFDSMKIIYNKAVRISNVFSYLSNNNKNYPNELKNILLNYNKSILENANNEQKIYKYVFKFRNNKAIVPTGFWNNKILYK